LIITGSFFGELAIDTKSSELNSNVSYSAPKIGKYYGGAFLGEKVTLGTVFSGILIGDISSALLDYFII